jgi:signal recognition particle subunit SEC65
MGTRRGFGRRVVAMRVAVQRCTSEEAARTLELELRGRTIKFPRVGRRTKGEVAADRGNEEWQRLGRVK